MTPDAFRRYAKAWTAGLFTVLTAVTQVTPLTDTQQQWAAIVLSLLGAVGVALVPNAKTTPTE